MKEKHEILRLNEPTGQSVRVAKACCVLEAPGLSEEEILSDSLPKGKWKTSALAAASSHSKAAGFNLLHCHIRQLDTMSVEFDVSGSAITTTVEVSGYGSIGVEMEALSAAMGSALGALDVIRSYDESAFISNAAIIRE